MKHTPWLPHLSFASTREERVARARERFFGEGDRPTGLVDEAVLQSWLRCTAKGWQRTEEVCVEPVSRLRLDTALRRSRQLREVAKRELQDLERALAATACYVMLVDPKGTVIYVSPQASASTEGLSRHVARLGVNLSEHVLGTNAPALVLRTGRPSTVEGGEHFFERIHNMRCAAAPIRDIHGQLAGVLDLTVEQRAFGFDPAVLVNIHATAIERTLMQVQSINQTLVEMHVQLRSLGTSGSGMMGLDEDGQVAWVTPEAARFTGASHSLDEPCHCEAVLGVSLSQLWQWAEQEHPLPLGLPNGLRVWLRVRLPAGDSSLMLPPSTVDVLTPTVLLRPVEAPSEPVSVNDEMKATQPSLVEHSRARIRETLRECNGNISEAARRLSISRGRIYRFLASTASGA